MLFAKSIDTKKAEPNPLGAISDAINAALSKSIHPATILSHLESCLQGLQQMALNRNTSASVEYDQVTLKPKNGRSAQRAAEHREAEELRRQQEEYAIEVSRRGWEQAIRDGKVA